MPKLHEVPGRQVIVGDKVSLWNPALPRIVQIGNKIIAIFLDVILNWFGACCKPILGSFYYFIIALKF